MARRTNRTAPIGITDPQVMAGLWTHPPVSGLGLLSYGGPTRSAPALWIPRGTQLPRLSWFLTWVVAVGVLGLAALSSWTIVGVVLPAAAVAVLLLAVDSRSRPSWPGAVAGLVVPLSASAWTNRQGPGLVCQVAGDPESCTDRWNPWLLAGAGVLALVVGVGLLLLMRERAIRRQFRTANDWQPPGW